MQLDANTLFMVTMQVEVILGLLLFFVWAQNFSKRALAWWGSAHLLRAVSIILLGMHGSVPDSLSIDFGNAVLFASFALTWSGARVFDLRKPEAALSLIGVAVWLAACRLPVFAAAPEMAPASPPPTLGQRPTNSGATATKNWCRAGPRS